MYKNKAVILRKIKSNSAAGKHKTLVIIVVGCVKVFGKQ